MISREGIRIPRVSRGDCRFSLAAASTRQSRAAARRSGRVRTTRSERDAPRDRGFVCDRAGRANAGRNAAVRASLHAEPRVPSMDRTADPCVDFYQYSCGGWMKNNPIPADQAELERLRQARRRTTSATCGACSRSSRRTRARPQRQRSRRSATTSPPAWTRPRSRSSARRRSRPILARDRRADSRSATCRALLARLHLDVDDGAAVLRLRLEPGFRGLHAGDRLRRRAAAWACPTATTT